MNRRALLLSGAAAMLAAPVSAAVSAGRKSHKHTDIFVEVDGNTGNVINGDPGGLQVTRVGVGQYDVTHPDWTEPFFIMITPRASDASLTQRDQSKVAYLWLNALPGYRVLTTDDDNGGAADILEDEHFMLHVREFD